MFDESAGKREDGATKTQSSIASNLGVSWTSMIGKSQGETEIPLDSAE
jgi:hypothetical protein